MAHMGLPILGIDISKAKFDVALLMDSKIKKTRVFENNPTGFKALSLWLIKQDITHLQACMEATGTYGDELATYLYDQGFEVSVVNPAQIKSFSGAQLNRAKTDKADAKLIAQFCASMQPVAWMPPPMHVRELQALVQRLAALLQMERQEQNRFSTAAAVIQPSIKAVLATISDHIDRHPDLKDQSKLLDSIPGIGVATISRLLAFVGDVHRFDDAKALAAFVGLNPTVHQSGSSVRGKSRLSKKGNATIRKALYMPAVVARRYNPTIKAFAQRLKNAGKSNMLIIGAVMRKLMHIIYGVLKSGKPFDANYAVKNA
jgi:transposase